MPERGKAYIGPQIKRQAGASRRPVCQISLIMTTKVLQVLIGVLQNGPNGSKKMLQLKYPNKEADTLVNTL